MKYRANFYDKNSDEFRSFTIEDAVDENDAECQAAVRADELKWPESFRLGDVEEI